MAFLLFFYEKSQKYNVEHWAKVNLFQNFFSDVPQVRLELGSTLNSSQIREGADVYFECSIKANPWIQKVSWRHNVIGSFTLWYFCNILDDNVIVKLHVEIVISFGPSLISCIKGLYHLGESFDFETFFP